MKLSIHNPTAAPQGVHCVDGRARYVKPGETRELDVADDADVRASAYLTVVGNAPKAPEPPPSGEQQIEQPKPKAGKAAPDPDVVRLRAEYAGLAGKKPFAGWKADRLQAEIDKLLAA